MQQSEWPSWWGSIGAGSSNGSSRHCLLTQHQVATGSAQCIASVSAVLTCNRNYQCCERVWLVTFSLSHWYLISSSDTGRVSSGADCHGQEVAGTGVRSTVSWSQVAARERDTREGSSVSRTPVQSPQCSVSWLVLAKSLRVIYNLCHSWLTCDQPTWGIFNNEWRFRECH